MPSIRPSAWGAAAGLAASLLVASAASADPGGEEAMRKVDASLRTSGEKVAVRMEIRGPSGSPRVRRFDMWVKAPPAQTAKSLIVFRDPPDVSGTAILTSDDGKSRQQWVYVPATGRTRRIASADRTESFVGSDFTLEDFKLSSDFVNRGYDLVREEVLGGVACQVIRDHPKTEAEKAASGYKEVLLWLEPGRNLIWRVDFYDKKGQLSKQLVGEDPKRYGDRWSLDRGVMTDLRGGSITVMQSEGREVGIALSDGKFSPGALASQ